MPINENTKIKFLETINQLKDIRGETLDKSFTAWIAENIFNLNNEEDIDRCIEIGSSGDWGIDFFQLNDDENTDQYIAWGQAKFSENCDYVLDRKDFEDFVNTIRVLEDPPNSSKIVLKEISEQFVNYRGRIRQKNMYFVFCGTMSDQVEELLNNPEWVAKNKDSDTNWYFYDIEKILELVEAPETPQLTVNFTPSVMEIEDKSTSKKTIVGYIPATEISRLYSDVQIRKTINNLNLREYQGRTKFNQGIADTLDDDKLKKKFWKINNGITATCEDIDDNTNNPNEYRIKNMKIVNGRQTSYTLYKKKALLDSDVLVKLIIHQTIDNDERLLISKCTNTQNAIKASDIITNKSLITQIQLKFEKYSNWYFETQRGSWKMLEKSTLEKITPRRHLEKETMARRMLAFNGEPLFAIKTRDEELLLVENNFNKCYEDKAPNDFIIPHIFYTLLEEVDSKWKESTTEKYQKKWPFLHKRIIKFYVLGFVKNSLDSLEKEVREQVLENIFEYYNKLKRDSDIDQKYLDIVISAFNEFTILYSEKNPHSIDKYTDEDVRKFLLKTDYFSVLLEHKEKKMELYPDAIAVKLKKLLDDEV